MTPRPRISTVAKFLHVREAFASSDLLRSLSTKFTERSCRLDAAAGYGACYGRSGPDRGNVRNWYPHRREFVSRAGTLRCRDPEAARELLIPDWLL